MGNFTDGSVWDSTSLFFDVQHCLAKFLKISAVRASSLIQIRLEREKGRRWVSQLATGSTCWSSSVRKGDARQRVSRMPEQAIRSLLAN